MVPPNSGRFLHRLRGLAGFTLVELMLSLVLLVVLVAMASPMFSSLIRNSQFRRDVSEIHGLIQATMNESLAGGIRGQLLVDQEQGRMTGVVVDLFDQDGDGSSDDWREIGSVDLSISQFGRKNKTETPWLQRTETAATSYGAEEDAVGGEAEALEGEESVDEWEEFENAADYLVAIAANGVVENSGAVFLNYENRDVVIEMLVSGAVISFYQVVGETTWSK